MKEATLSRARLIALVAIIVLIAIFVLGYARAPASDPGAHDDSPAEEIGAPSARR